MDAPRARRLSRTLGVLASIAVLILVVVGLLIQRSRPSLEGARRAFERGDWERSAADSAALLEREPALEPALRLRARSLSQLGRLEEALSVDAELGGDRLEALDLWLLARGWLQKGRPTLAWAALDAASRLDPRHQETAEALAKRPSSGPLAIPSRRADRLSAIPGGQPLAELVVGLASLGGDETSGANRLLEAALRRDRPTLLKVRSTGDARKLLARLLLEEGRPFEARAWLGKLDDPEASWLKGRAYLVEGDPERARASIERAGRFAEDQPMASEPARYLGAGQCVACHRSIFESQQASPHAKTLAWGDRLRAVPLPSGPVVDPENPAVSHRFDREGAQLRVSSTLGDQTVGSVIDYALGSGHHGVTMLGREPDGRHRSLRLSYYTKGEHWGLTSGFEAKPGTLRGYLGEVLNDESFRNCLNCHSTRFTSEGDRQGLEALDRGIGCERCHGPGDHHVRGVESDFPQLAIARPRRAKPADRLKLCAQCHASDGVIPPADPRFIRFQATTLPYSRCSSESGGRLDCVACHDPHRSLETDPAYYEARCLACHTPGPKPSPSIRLEPVTATLCPVNPSGGCLPCHMPKVENVMPFMSFTDHHIRIHRPEPKLGPTQGRP